LNELMIIAAVVAVIGAIGGYALVLQRDFIVPTGAGGAGGGGGGHA
jgi:hypothetical protein